MKERSYGQKHWGEFSGSLGLMLVLYHGDPELGLTQEGQSSSASSAT